MLTTCVGCTAECCACSHVRYSMCGHGQGCMALDKVLMKPCGQWLHERTDRCDLELRFKYIVTYDANLQHTAQLWAAMLHSTQKNAGCQETILGKRWSHTWSEESTISHQKNNQPSKVQLALHVRTGPATTSVACECSLIQHASGPQEGMHTAVRTVIGWTCCGGLWQWLLCIVSRSQGSGRSC